MSPLYNKRGLLWEPPPEKIFFQFDAFSIMLNMVTISRHKLLIGSPEAEENASKNDLNSFVQSTLLPLTSLHMFLANFAMRSKEVISSEDEEYPPVNAAMIADIISLMIGTFGISSPSR